MDLDFHPYRVPSPVADERFSALYVLAGLRFGRRAYVTPTIGLQFRRWSGSQRVVAADNGLAFGAALGTDLRLGPRATVSPELAVRAALIEVEGSVTAYALSLRLMVARGL